MGMARSQTAAVPALHFLESMSHKPERIAVFIDDSPDDLAYSV